LGYRTLPWLEIVVLYLSPLTELSFMQAWMRVYATMNEHHPSSKNVKQLRESKKLTVRKVCAEIDVAESTVLRWEAGTNKPHLPLDKVKVLMNLLDCDFDTLYGAFEQTWREKDDSVKKDLEPDKRMPIAV
jgi:DNA-binding transcriptional regulator YiaG